ncbi:hypothetical protein ASD31_13060 [Rhizobium sp. Root482]|nr:hypothetical protein ASD31_13060 [Rhizobium sp. Root482]
MTKGSAYTGRGEPEKQGARGTAEELSALRKLAVVGARCRLSGAFGGGVILADRRSEWGFVRKKDRIQSLLVIFR